MRVRLEICLLLLGTTAFAPAPLPRTPRRVANDITLAAFQGDWKAISMDTVIRPGQFAPAGIWFQGVRVKGEKWSYLVSGNENLSYNIQVDGSRRPAEINFSDLNDASKKAVMVGILRREGSRLTVLYYSTTPENRARDFVNMPANWWILVLERE